MANWLTRAHTMASLQEATDACFNNAITGGPTPDNDTERRRARALAILVENPDLRCAVVCEAGDPGHVMVAIRGVGSGELEIPADRYDAFALLALMDQHAAQSSNTVH